MTDEILAIDPARYKTNADIILAAAEMGYLPGAVLDLTYGKGSFWNRYVPDRFVTNDLDPACGYYHHDFRALPAQWADRFDTVVFDPPYKLDGTPGNGGPAEANSLYGVDSKRAYEGVDEVTQLYYDGLLEAYRVVSPSGYILVKCMDQVAASQTRWMSRRVANHLEPRCRHVTSFFLLGSRKQPSGRRQLNPRNNYSQLMVFKERSK